MNQYSGNHNTGSYSQHSHQEMDLFAVHGTGAITSAGVVGYYGPLVEGLEGFGEPLYDLLEQSPYQGGIVAVAQLAPPLVFGGLRLGSTLRDDMRGLPDHERPAFPDFVKLSQKMSVRIHVRDRLPFEHQATLLRRNNVGPTMGRLAMIIAREVNRFMDRERAIRNPLTHLGRELNVDDLVLVEVRHVSRGSIQPVLGVLRQ
ncbi:hypothetical protein LXA43DRAFT_575462 [Ganoderma leucocontextum]|nr:hypothetical protein LXA43DRAFT_575462 [Ganoderma leucocontextum]